MQVKTGIKAGGGYYKESRSSAASGKETSLYNAGNPR